MSAWSEKMKNIELQHANRFAPVLLVLLILYLCWKLAGLFWLLLAPAQVMQSERVELGSQQAVVPNIASFSLFQEASRATANDEQLNMQLQGVVVAVPNRYSSAVIKLNDVADRYLVGEQIAGSNYRVVEVFWDRVILSSGNGASKELNFKGIENGLYQPMVPNNPASNNANNTSTSAPNSWNGADNGGVNNAPNPANSTQNAIGQAVQNIQENREQYLREMGVNATGGGYEVSARTPAALRNKLGLQAGDRIMSLNGQTVAQGQNEAQLLEQARREGQVKLEIKRGDQVMTIQQDFK